MAAAQVLVLVAFAATASAFSGATSDPTAISAFNEWLRGKQFPSHKMDLKDGRLVASEDIHAGDLMFSVPFDLIISPKTAGGGRLGVALEDVPLPSSIVMSLFLIDEKSNPTSAFAPWLAVLPDKVASSLHFSEEELKELDGSMMQTITQQRSAVLAEEFKQVMAVLGTNHSALFPADRFTQEAYTWASSIVASRSIIVKAGNASVPVIVPYVDLASHHHRMNSTFDFDDKNNFKVVTHTAINKSEPIQISIGGRSNSQLLLSHGITVDNNDFDQVQLNVKVSEDDPFVSVKKTMLRNQGIDDSTTFVVTKLGISKALLAAMRVQALLPSEFDRFARAFQERPVSLRNELEVYRTLVMACQQLLKRYPTSYQEDVEKLKTNELSENVRNAVVLRKGEKEALLMTIDLVARMWDNFLVNGYDGEI